MGEILETFKSDQTDDNQAENAEQSESHERLPEPVYYVESPDDDSVLVGIDVSIDTYENDKKTIITWFDTTHERIMTAAETQVNDKYFAFKRTEEEGGGTYYFAPMDLSLYNERVKNKLIDGKDFDNRDDLIDAFLDTTKL